MDVHQIFVLRVGIVNFVDILSNGAFEGMGVWEML